MLAPNLYDDLLKNDILVGIYLLENDSKSFQLIRRTIPKSWQNKQAEYLVLEPNSNSNTSIKMYRDVFQMHFLYFQLMLSIEH